MIIPKITFYGLWPELAVYTKSKLKKYRPAIFAEKMSESNLDPKTEVLAVFVDSPVTKDVMARFPKLKLIVTMSTGYDHIDTSEAKKRGVVVCNVPAYGENTVAEHTFALILGLSRRLFESVKRVKEGMYDFHGLHGTDLKNKTLGIIGTGHIGAHVARIAQGFEMQIVAYDLKPNRVLASQMGFTYVPLNTLLKKADIVTLHAPLFESTYHLINKKNIKLMKQGSLLVNTARGALVEPEALLKELNNGHLGGAGLDVLEDENLVQHFEEIMRSKDVGLKLKTSLINNLLIDHPKTIVTPHNAFNSVEALQRIIDVTVENIISFAKASAINRVV